MQYPVVYIVHLLACQDCAPCKFPAVVAPPPPSPDLPSKISHGSIFFCCCFALSSPFVQLSLVTLYHTWIKYLRVITVLLGFLGLWYDFVINMHEDGINNKVHILLLLVWWWWYAIVSCTFLQYKYNHCLKTVQQHGTRLKRQQYSYYEEMNIYEELLMLWLSTVRRRNRRTAKILGQQWYGNSKLPHIWPESIQSSGSMQLSHLSLIMRVSPKLENLRWSQFGSPKRVTLLFRQYQQSNYSYGITKVWSRIFSRVQGLTRIACFSIKWSESLKYNVKKRPCVRACYALEWTNGSLMCSSNWLCP